MKRVLMFVLLVVTLLLPAVGCTLDQTKIERAALDIVADIPPPPMFYDTHSGYRMLPGEVECTIDQYTINTGEPLVRISIWYENENWVQRVLGFRSERIDLVFPNDEDQNLFLLEELENYHDKLIWRIGW